MSIGEAKAMPQESILAHEIQQRLMEAGISLSERQDRDEPTSRIYAIDGCPVEDASVGFITTVSARCSARPATACASPARAACSPA